MKGAEQTKQEKHIVTVALGLLQVLLNRSHIYIHSKQFYCIFITFSHNSLPLLFQHSRLVEHPSFFHTYVLDYIILFGICPICLLALI